MAPQGTLTETDEWRSEYTLISPTFGIKGRADALRRGSPVELKTGKNLNRDPRFQDKIQAASYALILDERAAARARVDQLDTGTLLYTKNTTLDRTEESGDLSPAKDFSIGRGLLEFVVRTRNEIAAMEHDASVPTGYEVNSKCEYCFEKDTCMVVSGRLDQESKAGAVGGQCPTRNWTTSSGSTRPSRPNAGPSTGSTRSSGTRRPKSGPTTTGRSSAWNRPVAGSSTAAVGTPGNRDGRRVEDPRR